MLNPYRKDKPVANVLGTSFSWSGLLDAAADIFAGVSDLIYLTFGHHLTLAVCFLVDTYLLGPSHLV